MLASKLGMLPGNALTRQKPLYVNPCEFNLLISVGKEGVVCDDTPAEPGCPARRRRGRGGSGAEAG